MGEIQIPANHKSLALRTKSHSRHFARHLVDIEAGALMMNHVAILDENGRRNKVDAGQAEITISAKADVVVKGREENCGGKHAQ